MILVAQCPKFGHVPLVQLLMRLDNGNGEECVEEKLHGKPGGRMRVAQLSFLTKLLMRTAF